MTEYQKDYWLIWERKQQKFHILLRCVVFSNDLNCYHDHTVIVLISVRFSGLCGPRYNIFFPTNRDLNDQGFSKFGSTGEVKVGL